MNYHSHPLTLRDSSGPNRSTGRLRKRFLFVETIQQAELPDGSVGSRSFQQLPFSNPSPKTTPAPSTQATPDDQTPAAQQCFLSARQARSDSRGPRSPWSRFAQVSSPHENRARSTSSHPWQRQNCVTCAPLSPAAYPTIPIPSPTSQHPNSDQDFPTQDPSRRRKSSSSPWHQYLHFLGAVD